MVTDFVNRDNVDGLINAPFSGNPKGSIATYCLDTHTIDWKLNYNRNNQAYRKGNFISRMDMCD